METAEMGRVTTEVTIYNLGDLIEVRRGKLPADQVRMVIIPDALVDTGATSLCLTRSVIDRLGLMRWGEKVATTAGGPRSFGIYEAVRLEIMGRDATVDPIEVPEGTPVLVGQIPLEAMDWVVDPRGQRLIGNPAHGGEQMLELYSMFDPPA